MSNLLSFTKGHGTGNDFVLFLDAEGEVSLTQEQIAQICDRHFGIGADGLIRVVKSENLPEGEASLAEEPTATWFMDYYNADGSTAEMCGNGTRVFARYLTEKGLVELPEGETLSIGTRAGVKDIQRNLAGFAVDNRNVVVFLQRHGDFAEAVDGDEFRLRIIRTDFSDARECHTLHRSAVGNAVGERQDGDGRVAVIGLEEAHRQVEPVEILDPLVER